MRYCSLAWARGMPRSLPRSRAASSGSPSAWRWPASAIRRSGDDVAQQAFEQAWRHAPVYDSELARLTAASGRTGTADLS